MSNSTVGDTPGGEVSPVEIPFTISLSDEGIPLLCTESGHIRPATSEEWALWQFCGEVVHALGDYADIVERDRHDPVKVLAAAQSARSAVIYFNGGAC
jgi:hypothetical protein